MPLGLIFGAVVFGVIGGWMATRAPLMAGVPARALGVLFASLSFLVALGLLLRQRWGRWAGTAVALLLSVFGGFLVLQRGALMDFVVLAASLGTVLLLVIPVTGDGRRGLPADARPFAAAGRVVAWMSLAVFLTFLGTGVFALRLAPAPTRSRHLSGHAPSGAAPRAGEGPAWLDYGAGLERAKASGKPILADFYATWCGPCKAMDRRTFRDPSVVRRFADLVAVRVDCEETTSRSGHRGVDLAERYGVGAYPTLVLIDPDGRELSRRTGYLSPSELLDWMNRSLRDPRGALAATQRASL